MKVSSEIIDMSPENKKQEKIIFCRAGKQRKHCIGLSDFGALISPTLSLISPTF